ncbi:MAG: hypothetical protein A4E62_01201 [Syntrophorhabdus sp. PtaU1.Bin002]|nr:MAG: hypothetical protein A4E58_01268 [Syntrophorhabdus sp. PtaB.Bin006]OPY71503.1 MAG: hypothetical protein A4E62_01201 [Syntrophorhabdus sp. PtaU1.Bin002]
MYEERFYRSITKPDDLRCYEVRFKETDLLCCTRTDLKSFIEDRLFFYRHQLEEYIRKRTAFGDSLVPIDGDPFAPAIVKEMIEGSARVGVGPMATVAGAIAEFLGRDISSLTGEYIVENGGDICLKTDRERAVLIYAKDSPFSRKIALKLRGRDKPYGVCTSSGTVGHSLSLGRADAVCIVADSALFADGLATCIGNIVKQKDDIPMAIEKGKVFPGVIGILIVVGDGLGIWGDLEIIRV